jgi:hypothetical protein
LPEDLLEPITLGDELDLLGQALRRGLGIGEGRGRGVGHGTTKEEIPAPARIRWLPGASADRRLCSQ